MISLVERNVNGMQISSRLCSERVGLLAIDGTNQFRKPRFLRAQGGITGYEVLWELGEVSVKPGFPMEGGVSSGISARVNAGKTVKRLWGRLFTQAS
jgi:hypothetical protein